MNYKPKVLGISGRKSSGKDTLADYLVRNAPELFNFPHFNSLKIRKYSPADRAKDFLIHVFGLTREQCYGTEEQKETLTSYYKNQYGAVHHYPAPVHGQQRLTAREVMEWFGTFITTVYGEGPIRDVLQQIREDNPYLAVIPNVRTCVEIEEIKNWGGRVIRLLRNPYPGKLSFWESSLDEWTEYDGILDNRTCSVWETQIMLLGYLKEWGWIQR